MKCKNLNSSFRFLPVHMQEFFPLTHQLCIRKCMSCYLRLENGKILFSPGKGSHIAINTASHLGQNLFTSIASWE